MRSISNNAGFNQTGAALLEASIALPLILGVFIVASDTAQLLYRQSVFIDVSNHTLRGMELNDRNLLIMQSCSQIIKTKVNDDLIQNGVSTSESALKVSTTRIDPSKLKVTISLYSDSIYGGISMTQQSALATDNSTTFCLEDFVEDPPNQSGDCNRY